MKGDNVVVLGRLGAPYGVRGWLRLQPDTDEPDALLAYGSLLLIRNAQRERRPLEAGQRHGRGLVVKFAGIGSREAAARWSGGVVGVERTELPPLGADEYYWHDLIGLEVLDVQRRPLGRVSHLVETGANDVLVVAGTEGEILIPYIRAEVIKAIDLDAGTLVVDWLP